MHERIAPALVLDDLVMLIEHCRGVAILRKWPRLELEAGVTEYVVGHLRRDQRHVGGIGDRLRRLGPHRNAKEIVVAADGQIVGRDPVRRRMPYT